MAGIYKDEHIPEEFTAELRELCSQYDHDNDGTINIREIIASLDKHVSEEDIDEIVHAVSTNADGKISFEDFQMYLMKKMKEIESVEDVKGMFMTLDRTESGNFTPSELRQAILSYGETISLDEATDLVNSIQTTEPGKINYDEFCHLVKTVIGRQ